jgi:hypothetical protein
MRGYWWEIREWNRDVFYHPFDLGFYRLIRATGESKLFRWAWRRGLLEAPYEGCYLDEMYWRGPLVFLPLFLRIADRMYRNRTR